MIYKAKMILNLISKPQNQCSINYQYFKNVNRSLVLIKLVLKIFVYIINILLCYVSYCSRCNNISTFVLRDFRCKSED